jgi:hypothetical protein
LSIYLISTPLNTTFGVASTVVVEVEVELDELIVVSVGRLAMVEMVVGVFELVLVEVVELVDELEEVEELDVERTSRVISTLLS